MSKIQKLELTWVGKDEKEEIEPRILVENPELSHVYNRDRNGQLSLINKDGDFDNMLIHGDNLLALKALEQDFAGKVKCIYIDPPYNTGSAFEHYDDNLEHSIWLNLMRSRLELLRNLLRDDGIIAIEIDDNEQAYLKVLCDEIFGRNNFVTMLTIESGEVFGTKAAHINKTFVKVKDYILLYKKNSDIELQVRPLWTKIAEPFDSHYSNFINEDTLEKIPLLSIIKSNNDACKLFEQYQLRISLENISKLMDLNKQFCNYILNELSTKIFQDQPYTVDLGGFAQSMQVGKIYKKNGRLLFKTSGGTIRYYKPFSDSLHLTDDYVPEYCRSTARGDLWKNYHTDMRNIDDEGNVKFKSSKKSERLIRDILYSLTNEGDLVLDSFLGSGTTCAVAHKMKRKWIGVEMGNHAYTHCIPRINSVIEGTDLTGVTERTNWQGGGSYKFYELAPSLVIKDSHGREIINPEYNANMLAAAMAKHEGFKYNPDRNNAYKQGFASEKSFIFTTTNHITAEYLDEIASNFADDEYLIINCKSFDGNIANNYKNITIKKIPQSILGKCVFNKDNYNLNIINLPVEDDNAEE